MIHGTPLRMMYEHTPAMTPYAILRGAQQDGHDTKRQDALVRQRYNQQRKECRDGISNVVPVDFTDTEKNQSASHPISIVTRGTHFRIMSDPTITSAPPVAHPGIDAKIGAKNTDMKNARPVVMAVMPVFPPSTQHASEPDFIYLSASAVTRTTDTGRTLDVRCNRTRTH